MKLKYSLTPIIILLVFLFSSCSSKLPTELYDKAVADAAKDSRHSRTLSNSEIIKQLKAYEDFIYNNKKPKSESLPVKLMLKNSSGVEQAYLVLPDSEMSDNQLLQYVQLSANSNAPDMPSKDELQYSEVKALSSQFLTDYGFDFEEIENTYVLYSKPKEPFTEGLWNAFISTKSGNDYQVVIYAKSRIPYMINRCAQDKYSLNKTAEEMAAAKEFTDEEILSKAQEYFDRYNLKASKVTLGSSSITTGSPSNGHAYYRSVAFNTDNLFVQMNIDMSNLSLCGITISLL